MRRTIMAASLAMCSLSAGTAWATMDNDTLRVLVIGSSYSADAVEQNLCGMAEADGIPMAVMNLYGGTLAENAADARADAAAFGCCRVTSAGRVMQDGPVRLSEVLGEARWDVVTLEQPGEACPDYGSYEPGLKDLLKYVRKRTGKDTRIMWHQLWAFESADGTSSYLLDHYGARSYNMFHDIAAASARVRGTYGLETIPAGAALENLRSGFTREGTTRNGRNLSPTIGQYTAACAWFEALTGRSCQDNAFVPEHLRNHVRRDAAKRAAHAAILHCDVITSQMSGRGQYGSAEAGYYTRDEKDVKPYTLPDPLKMEDGTPVTTVQKWENERRPELLELFRSEVYGHSAPRQEGQHYRILSEDHNALGGLATKKEVALYYTADEKGKYMQLLMYIPNEVEGPAPAFMMMNHFGNSAVRSDEDIAEYTREQKQTYGVYGLPHRGQTQHRFPIELIVSRGYAFVTFYKGDVDPDYDDGFLNGVTPYIYEQGQTYPYDDQWGTISAWAWGYSRALDYLETDPQVDAHRVAAIGHSRSAKTALWTVAQDRRFAMSISNCSGCSGAALSRRRFGQTVRAIQCTFPNWFCTNYLKYMDNENALPVDQHELIALIAPRPVYIASASLDNGADPRGEFLSELAAMPVYKLYGYSGLESTEFPSPRSVIYGDHMEYHLRDGRHDMLAWDWVKYLDFADKYLR